MPIFNGGGGGGGGITIEVDPNSLPLTGGTLTGDLTIDGGAAGNKSFVINSVENWTIGMSDGTIEGWRLDANEVPFNSYHLAVDGNEALFRTCSNDTGAEWNMTQISGSSIYLYTYEGLLSSNLTHEKIQFGNDGANLGILTKDSLRFEDGITDITIDATGVKFPNPQFASSLSRGTFDSGRSSYNGISLICTQGIELNWQAGYLKALNGSSVVPINVESNIALSNSTEVSANNLNISVSGWQPEEERVWTTSQNYSSFSGVSGDDNFHLNNGSVGGVNNGGANTYGLSVDSAGGDDDAGLGWGISHNGAGGHDEYNSWGLSPDGVGGSKLNEFDDNQTWSFGINGAKFVDNSIQTTAYIVQNVGTSELGTSGNIAHSDYPLEIILVINSIPYAIPARQFD
jgi:hypothetical protein